MGDKWFEDVGGLDILNVNFNKDRLLYAINKLPDFYKETVRDWSEVSQNMAVTKKDVLCQPIWFNNRIKLQVESKRVTGLISKGISATGEPGLNDTAREKKNVSLNRGIVANKLSI